MVICTHTVHWSQVVQIKIEYSFTRTISLPSPLLPSHPQPATFHNSAEQLQLYYLSSRKFPTIFQQQEDHISLHTFDRPLDEGEPGGRGRGGKNHRSKLTFRKPANWTTYIRTRCVGGCSWALFRTKWVWSQLRGVDTQSCDCHIYKYTSLYVHILPVEHICTYTLERDPNSFLKFFRPTPDPVQITAYTRIKEATPEVDPVRPSVVTSDTHWL